MARRIKGIWEKYGFYVVLCLCVLTIATTAFYTRYEDSKPPATLSPQPSQSSAAQTKMPVPLTTPAVQTLASPEPSAGTPNFVPPLDGKWVEPFSGETSVYNQTLGHYATHEAVDIAASYGALVKSCAGGTVLSVYEDPLLGGVVQVDHGGGYVAVYASLCQILVAQGDPVAAQDTLGCAGIGLGEEHLGAHLHLRMEKDGVAVDPVSLFAP